jgi:hypothetical protein
MKVLYDATKMRTTATMRNVSRLGEGYNELNTTLQKETYSHGDRDDGPRPDRGYD